MILGLDAFARRTTPSTLPALPLPRLLQRLPPLPLLGLSRAPPVGLLEAAPPPTILLLQPETSFAVALDDLAKTALPLLLPVTRGRPRDAARVVRARNAIRRLPRQQVGAEGLHVRDLLHLTLQGRYQSLRRRARRRNGVLVALARIHPLPLPPLGFVRARGTSPMTSSTAASALPTTSPSPLATAPAETSERASSRTDVIG